MKKKWTLIIILVLFVMAALCQGQGYAATFFDDFDTTAYTVNNWFIAEPSWSFVSINGSDQGYHGSSTGTETAATIAQNGLSYYNAGLSIETLIKVTESALHDWDDGGVAFSLNPGNYGYYAEIDPGDDMLILGDVEEYFERITVPVSLDFDTFYLLRINVDQYEVMNISVWDESGTIKLGEITDQAPILPTSSGMVGIYADGEVTFNNYTHTGTPVPLPGSVLLFGSGLIGLAGVGRKKFRQM